MSKPQPMTRSPATHASKDSQTLWQIKSIESRRDGTTSRNDANLAILMKDTGRDSLTNPAHASTSSGGIVPGEKNVDSYTQTTET